MLTKKCPAPGGYRRRGGADAASEGSNTYTGRKNPRQSPLPCGVVASIAGAPPPSPDWVGLTLAKGSRRGLWRAFIHTGVAGETKLTTKQLTTYEQFRIRAMLAACVPLPGMSTEEWFDVLNTAMTILRFEERAA